jgi:hypothetical protein
MPGTTSYLDTPLVALAAFAAHGGAIDTEAQSLTPVIKSVGGPETGGGPVMCSARAPPDHPITGSASSDHQPELRRGVAGFTASPATASATAGSVTSTGPAHDHELERREIVADVPAASSRAAGCP